MNILIIYCHPSKKSYTYYILEKIITQFSQLNWNVKISDLYKLNFKSDMSEEEYARESLSKIELPKPWCVSSRTSTSEK
jgi:NAD(P)H dehydrogenase (quinone)